VFVVFIAQDLPGDVQSFTWDVPPDLVTEGGRVRVVARDQAGNVGVADAPAVPDLIVTNVTVNPTMAASGDRVMVQITIMNQGAAPAREVTHRLVISSDTVIDLTDRGLAFARNDELAPGGSVAISVEVRIPRMTNPGLNYVGVIADFGNQVRERNEINNTASTPITIIGSG
jgi:subtilase family serine protease